MQTADAMSEAALVPTTAAGDDTDISAASDAGGTPLVKHRVAAGVLAAATAAVAFAAYSDLARALLAAVFAAVLVILGVIDLEQRRIPNRIVLPATALVFVAHIAIAPGRTLELVLAPLAAAAFLFAPNLITSSAIGMGDVKLALLLGAGLGWGVIGALLVGFLAMLPFAVVMLISGGSAARKATLPLGTFLAFGGLVVLIMPKLL